MTDRDWTPSTEPVRFDDGPEPASGLLLRPEQAGPQPAVVVLPAIAGINPYVERVCAHLCRRGLAVLVLDYYGGEAAPDLSTRERIGAAVAALPDERVLSQLQTSVSGLGRTDGVVADRIGIVGFCIGGSYALMAASLTDGVSCTVGFYGLLQYAQLTENKPRSPIDTVEELRTPFLGHFGDDDHLVAVHEVRDLQRRTTGKPAEVYRYPGAGHAFHEDFRDVYRPVAAQTAWLRTGAFLDWHLKGEQTLATSTS